MDATDSKSADAARKAARHPPPAIPAPIDHDYDDDDDESLYQLAAVSDGFRPDRSPATTTVSPGPSPRTSISGPSSTATPSSPRSHNYTVSPPTRPSSIAKHPLPRDSFSLQNDGASSNGASVHGNFASASAAASATPSALSRQSSASTSSSNWGFPGAGLARERPYEGPSGPSHPYAMYSQGVGVNRTMSVATTSTIEPLAEQPYSGPRGPAHPYGLYSQNTQDSVAPQNAMPSTVPMPTMPTAPMVVGFPGVAPTADLYQRRLGPDGEEIGGLIGPHGHTEELPPYTRYPDEQLARKVRDAATTPGQPQTQPPQAAGPSTALPALSVLPAIAPIPGAGGIGMAARNPEFDSVDDLRSPQSRHSTRSFTSTSDVSHHQINAAAAAVASEKPNKPENRWQRAGRRRLCGIVPYWAVLLTLVAFLIMGIVLGAVLGTYVAKRDKRPPGDQPGSQPTTRIYDAVPIPIPTDLPALPEGRFGLPLAIRQQPNVCFNNTDQSQAWSCNIVFGMGALTAMEIKKTDDVYSVSLTANETMTLRNRIFAYGTQPHDFPGFFDMQTVNDTLESSRGPAWFKYLKFDKTVIVPEAMIPSPTPPSPKSNRRRDPIPMPTFGPGDLRRHVAAQPGDKPWICTWPDTMLEIFIYPNQNSNPMKANPDQPSTLTPLATATPTPTRAAGSFQFTDSALGAAANRFTTSTPLPTASVVPTDIDFVSQLSAYPRIVKLEERRLKESPQPVCRQVRIQSDGSSLPVLDSNNRPIEVAIVEVGNSPSFRQMEKKQHRQPPPPRNGRRDYVPESHMLMSRGTADISDCGCLWFMA